MDIERAKLEIKTIAKETFFGIRTFLIKNIKIVIKLFLGGLLCIVILVLVWFLIHRKHSVVLTGELNGQPYTIQYLAQEKKNYQPEIDSLLKAIVAALDSHEVDTEVSQFNDFNCASFDLKSPFLYTILNKSKQVYQDTHGAFDPTVGPLVDYWQKCWASGMQSNTLELHQVQDRVGLDYIVVNAKRVKKLKEGVKVDFDKLLFSYAVDEVGGFLQKAGIDQYCIKLGDSVLVHGYDSKKPCQISQTLGQNDSTQQPLVVDSRVVDKGLVMLMNQSFQAGKNQCTIMDPQSGYVAPGDIVAVIVFAQDCMMAHAYGIALQAKGFRAAVDLLATLPGISALIVHKNEDGKEVLYTSAGLVMEEEPASRTVYVRLVDKPS